MDHGLKAPLSPDEEVTLRRVGYGIAKPNELTTRHVARLASLALIEWRGERLVPTQLGRERLAAMPGAYRDWASRGADRHRVEDQSNPTSQNGRLSRQ